MKGIVFQLLEEVIRKEYTEDTWDDLLSAAGLDGIYTSLETYPHEDLARIVAAASAALNLPEHAIIRWFGRNALPILAEKYPEFFEPHTTTRAFLLTLNDVIHPEVRKMYPGADVPVFDYDTTSEDVLILEYASARKLCAFAEGLIEGAAVHYGETAYIEQTRCTRRGDARCEFALKFEKKAP